MLSRVCSARVSFNLVIVLAIEFLSKAGTGSVFFTSAFSVPLLPLSFSSSVLEGLSLLSPVFGSRPAVGIEANSDEASGLEEGVVSESGRLVDSDSLPASRRAFDSLTKLHRLYPVFKTLYPTYSKLSLI